MHRKVLLFFGAFVYYALALYALRSFESGILLSSVVLFGLPAYVLARYSAAPSAILTSVIVFGAGLAIVLEGVAHIYGIWYTIGVDELRLFGLIPLEVIFTSIIQTLFLALLYELIFDDGEYTTSKSSTRFVAFGVFSFSALALIAIHAYILKGIFFSHSYIWILCILVASTLATLSVTHSLTLRFVDRLVSFSLCAWIPLSIGLFLAVANTHKVFAYTHDYLYTFNLFGSTIPLEEIILTLVLPLFVATFYEVYLDDGKIKEGE